jgi:leucyl/phenylalanyl-tRNA--protein transferase
MIHWLDPDKPPYFPDTSEALQEPRGLLAAGGKLSLEWLLVAYRQGIFPWFSANEPILWWSPAPRTVLLPENFHLSKSLNKLSRQNRYRLSQNQAFEKVIRECAAPRDDYPGTWIVKDMIEAYIEMHRAGFANSIECWDANDQLVGGLYGITLGKVFFGESMFSKAANTSKLCLKFLLESGIYELIDCQLATEHLTSLGTIEMNREEFESMLDQYTV